MVLSGPIFFGALPRFSFFKNIKSALISLAVPIMPFLVWDSIVTDKHWFFNDLYITGIKLFKLPIEEILFFITVPYACIFTWEMLNRHTAGPNFKFSKKIYLSPFVLIPIGLLFYLYGKEYTGLVFISMSIAVIYDRLLSANLFLHKNFINYLILISLFTLIFNGFLTWRPVVTYDEIYQLNFRILTIPIEDFFYGMSLLFISTSTYIKLNAQKYE